MKMTLVYRDDESITEIKIKFEIPGYDYSKNTVREWRNYIQQQECYQDLTYVRTEVEVDK